LAKKKGVVEDDEDRPSDSSDDEDEDELFERPSRSVEPPDFDFVGE
jgi:hypothetical protein